MSSNSLSMTNTKDATFNNLSLVTSNDVKNVYDIFALKNDLPDLSGIQSQINDEVNRTGDTFTGSVTAPNITVDASGSLITANLIIRPAGTATGLTPSMVNLGNVNNTSDANKPISIATQAALKNKADKK